MKRWTLDDIPWDKFDPTKIAAEIVPVVKTASLVEYNSGDYAAYLRNVFSDDPAFQDAADAWASEERQHGQALGQWAQKADPGFDFEASFQHFVSGYRISVESTTSIRGSRSGELIARCVVESGTSSMYTALRDATDDPAFQDAADAWASEERQHGQALGQWAQKADPGFDFEASFQHFVSGYRISVESTTSIRGTRSGELIARCVVESGTSSMYTALRDATDEPALKAICHRIAGDEFRHFKMFYRYLQGYLPEERLSLMQRLMVVCGRFLEVGDDELAFAYHCANEPNRDYDRAKANKAYTRVAAGLYQRAHLDRAVGMMLKASGVSPEGRFGEVARRLAWFHLQRQHRRAAAA